MKSKNMSEKMFQHCPDISEWKFLITCKNMTHYFGRAESFLQGRQKFIYRKKKKPQSALFFTVILDKNAKLVPVQHLSTALEYPIHSLLIRVIGRGFSPLLLWWHK